MRNFALILLGLLLAAPAASAQPAPFTLFPVIGGAHYTDDFGDPRGGGRHEGNDLLAACGTPVVAVVGGRVRLDYGSRSGWMVTLNGRSSWYRYIHMDGSRGKRSALAPGLRNGTRVKAGDVISYVGNTGDAAGGPCHLHFELHRGKRVSSPYAYLQAATILHLDPANPTGVGTTAAITLTIAGRITWAAAAGDDGRIVVLPTTITSSGGETIDHPASVVLRATPDLVAAAVVGRTVTVVTAPGDATSERLGLPPLAWSAASLG